MVYSGCISARQRTVASAATLLIAVGVGFGLANGLDLDVVRKAAEAITAIEVPAPPPPREPTVPSDAASEQASGKASAPNKHAKATQIVAPQPVIPPIERRPITAASRAGAGNDTSAGATPQNGPGSGAGGQGDGTGADGTGTGTGGGTKAAWRSGSIRDSDYPESASSAQIGGEVEVGFTIESSGRVSACRVTRSSGDAQLDGTTCRLIEARFRFKPATNAAGTPVASQYGWRQNWWLERRR